MRAGYIIRKKRDAAELSREEIAFLIEGATNDRVPDYQLAAFLMAVLWRGMTRAELAALTESMLNSGEVLDWSDLPAPKVDKHSTGGVGDKTSLVIAPIVAAAGLYVPMISGRGLGHTGGTLDKLESIPGFNVNLQLDGFRRTLALAHCALIGQTPEIAPADKKLYALRDVTATVESPYLITASIMSKKMAEGIDALVLDVKTGDGAFMKKREDAEYLRELMLELGGWMLVVGEGTKTVSEGRELAAEMIASGRARDTFREVIELQGGEVRVVDDPSLLPHARHTAHLPAKRSGFVTAIRCEQVGVASMTLGGGREKKEDSVDPGVGLALEKKIGDRVEAGENLCTIHYNQDARLVPAVRLLSESFEIGDSAPAHTPLVRKIIGAGEYS